jgi:hypothetical protein
METTDKSVRFLRSASGIHAFSSLKAVEEEKGAGSGLEI